MDIEDYTWTRFLWLKNINTNEIEECFDDSVLEDNNFSFMKIGETYHCKINLFGKASLTPLENYYACKIIQESVPIGKKVRAKIELNGGIYYIPKQDISFLTPLRKQFYYSYTRKDLMQVNDTIHFDYR